MKIKTRLSSRRRDPEPRQMTSLPTEIRLLIYSHYFADSQILYTQHRSLLALLPNRRKRPARLQGPRTIALLLTSKTIYHEALPILHANLTLTISHTDLFTALSNVQAHTHPHPCSPSLNPIPTFLSTLITNTRHLTFTRIDSISFSSIITNSHGTPPHPPLPHLSTITIFGFWPLLRRHLSATDFVSPARRLWHLEYGFIPRLPWQLRSWLPTLDGEVDLQELAVVMHCLFDRRERTVRVRMRAWSLGDAESVERPAGAEVLEVRCDLDDGERWWEWERVVFPEMGRWGWGLGGCMWPYLLGREWEGFKRESERRKQLAREEFEEEGVVGENVKGFGRKGRRLVEGQVLSEKTKKVDDKAEMDFGFDEDGNQLWWGMTQAEIDALGDEDDEDEGVIDGGALSGGGGNGGGFLPAAAVPATAAPPLSQRETPVLINTPSASTRLSAASASRYAPDASTDWATITDSGDWQSVRSVDFAFKQWDSELAV